jgi:hypothetical protein
MTDADGRCSIASYDSGYKIDKLDPDIHLHVDSVAYEENNTAVNYNPGQNHDEEGDSDGTTIVLQRPP